MGLRYEVGLHIKTGHICWWHGPFPPGDMNDNMIFNDVLTRWIEYRERVGADLGFKASALLYGNCP